MDDLDLTKNEELQKALQEFEEEYAKEEEEMKPPEKVPQSSRLAQWMIKHSQGKITTEKEAEYVMLGFVVLALLASALMVFGVPNFGRQPRLSDEEVQQLLDRHDELSL